MDTKSNLISFLVSLSLLAALSPIGAQVFDVTTYGNGLDITTGLRKGWNDACASPTPSMILIPKGVFNLRVVKLEGPCRNRMTIKVAGIVKAPADPSEMNSDGWITINTVNGLTIYGGGTFDGQGKIAWQKNDCHLNQNCAALPVSLRFNYINDSVIDGITSLDSKFFHINLFACNNMTFKRVNIFAPTESLNTDGIHLGESTRIKVIKSNIHTGDDCISMGPGSRAVRIVDVTCGPGHGISVGSLGGNPGEPPIVGITVKNCTFTRTMNGVRVKVWPKANAGSVRYIRFHDLIMDDVQYPVIIDQAYCPHNLCVSEMQQSLVKIRHVSIKNVRGTTSTREAVTILCSGTHPCEGVEISDVDLEYHGVDGPAMSVCSNVKPVVSGTQNPAICSHIP